MSSTITDGTTVAVNIDGVDFEATVTIRRNYDTGRVAKKARVYVWGAPEPTKATVPSHHTQRCDRKKDAGHHAQSCGSCIFDKMWDTYNREVVKVMRNAAEQALKGVGIEPIKMSFSRTAGCSCPCSPGFIVQEGNSAHLLWDKSVSIDLAPVS